MKNVSTMARVLGAVFTFAFVVDLESFAQAPSDPVALLRGVEQSRKPLHGTLKLRWQSEKIEPKGPGSSLDYLIEFDRDRYRFIEVSPRLVSTNEDAEKRNRVIEANGGDLRAAERAGLGKMTEEKVTSIYDGKKLVQYSDNMGCYIRVHQAGSIFLCFDVRLLGLIKSHSPNYSFDDHLIFNSGEEISMVGREEVNGHSVWHVKVARPNFGVEYHYWISSAKGFRVHRFEWLLTGDQRAYVLRCNLDYAGSQDHVLPTRVVVEEVRSGTVRSRDVFTVLEADYATRPDSSIFGWKGLGMTPGQMVIDNRLNRVVGFYNGEGLSEDSKEALALAALTVAQELNPSSSRWFWYAAGVLFLLVLAGFLVRRRIQKRRGV